MPTINGSITGFGVGNDISVFRTVTSVPPGDTLAKAWLTVKVRKTDADPGVFQKVITTVAVGGQGQITDSGGSGTGIIRFDIRAADTVLLTPDTLYEYDIKVKTAAGLIGTIETGKMMGVGPVTLATT